MLVAVAVLLAVAFGLGFFTGHAGPTSKLYKIEEELSKVEGTLSGAGHKLYNKIKEIL